MKIKQGDWIKRAIPGFKPRRVQAICRKWWGKRYGVVFNNEIYSFHELHECNYFVCDPPRAPRVINRPSHQQLLKEPTRWENFCATLRAHDVVPVMRMLFIMMVVASVLAAIALGALKLLLMYGILHPPK